MAVAAGLPAGLARAWWGGRHLTLPELCLAWLVPVAFLPQWLAFYLPATRELIPDGLAATALISSQILLLIFAWFNRSQPGFRALGLGLALNLLVIALNRGLMPISPDVVARLAPEAPPSVWQIGHRLGTGKDIVLPVTATQLWWLSDRFLLPGWFPYQAAFSLGDVLIAAGALWLLWTMGGGAESGSQVQDKCDGIVPYGHSAVQQRAQQARNRSSG
jgi:hypothetical protein